MPSRNPEDLHPPLAERWFWLRDRFMDLYPTAPEPRLSATYRSDTEQLEAYRRGMSNARPGQSLHNFTPAYAFDVFFNDNRNTPLDKSDDLADWDMLNFRRMGELAESIGLEWGGRWPHLVDGPHIQMPMTWQDAEAGRVPHLPPLPEDVVTPDQWKLVVMDAGSIQAVITFSARDAIVTNVSMRHKRHWVDVKRDV